MSQFIQLGENPRLVTFANPKLDHQFYSDHRWFELSYNPINSSFTMCAQFVTVLLCCLTVALSNDSRKNEKGEMIAFPDDLNLGRNTNQNLMMFPQHHHHRPSFYPYHHHHHHYPDQEEEEEEDELHIEPNKNVNESLQIPLDYINSLNQHNVTDLLLNYIDGEEITPLIDISSRFGDEGQERSAATVPKGADCMPELTTVKIAGSDDPTVLHIPQCTRVERCGGCCKHELLSCQPLKKENVPFKIYKTQYTGQQKLKFLGTEVVIVERHTKCKCLCKVKAEDCGKFQEYRENECQCACKNHDERKKCLQFSEKKLWNPHVCACQCKESTMCSTGSYFDQNECRCVALNRRFENYYRPSYRQQPQTVINRFREN